MKHQIFLGVLLLLATGYCQSSGAQQQPAASAEQNQTAQETKVAQTQTKIPAGSKVFRCTNRTPLMDRRARQKRVQSI